jgi:23S rRNA (adenine2503-C2)-methyltransferase
VGRLRSGDGASGKLVLALEDGEEIESVWMRDGQRRTFCISSQAGCALGCTFCATGAAGFGRNLKLGEILGQVMSLARAEGWPANIVVMGMGEPLLNLDAVVPALESLSDPQRFGLGVRRITVSTAGVTPAIWELSRCSVRPNLALSLNSPFNAQRSELMPVNRRYPLSGVLKACKAYGESSGRHVLFEYLLLGGVNTSPPAACAVARLAREAGAWVNLIPFNPVPGCGFHPPERQEVQRFRAALEERGVRVTERFRRGRDILAACGQLRGKHPDGAVSRCPAVAQKQP